MHQTTVRFGRGSYAALQDYCEREGVSMASFIREATMAHLATIERRHQQAHIDAEVARKLADLQQQVEQLQQAAGIRRRGR